MKAFELFGTIAINSEEAMSALDDVGTKGKKLASGLSSAFTTAGKAVAKGAAAGAAAVGALAVASVKTYAEYEQLVGGVETLFKESSAAVMDYANNAYKTAGLSANEYMATVTSFSASLLQGLGEDTVAAANIANVAITDMADNANKMGTSIELIQNAYQGFAKQNYTMLDNLKLGYGGTASEMARLINDSGVLGDAFKATAENLREIPFDKQIEAIHAIQEEMGITGTTALEASETISGSWASVGAAWKNLLVGISDDTQNLDVLINNFSESTVTAFLNIAERVPSILKGLVGVATGLFGELFDYISIDLLNTGLSFETFASKAQEVFSNVASAVSGFFGACGSAVQSAIGAALGAIDSLKQAWAGLKSALSPISTSVSVHYSSSGQLHAGGAGKAFAAGAVFSKPTFFNTRLGNTLVGEGGESEAVAPISVLQGYVADAVASQNAGVVNALERVVDAIDNMNDNMGSNLRGALDGVSVGVNKREFGRLVKAVT